MPPLIDPVVWGSVRCGPFIYRCSIGVYCIYIQLTGVKRVRPGGQATRVSREGGVAFQPRAGVADLCKSVESVMPRLRKTCYGCPRISPALG
jgi:hypothetical protein